MTQNPKLVAKMHAMSFNDLYAKMFTDGLTKLQNREAFIHTDFKWVAVVDLDSLKFFNDTFGRGEGNKHLRSLAHKLSIHFGYDNCFRLSGDEFLVIGTHKRKLQKALRDLQVLLGSFSFGVGKDIATADALMHKNKEDRIKTGERADTGEEPPNMTVRRTTCGQTSLVLLKSA